MPSRKTENFFKSFGDANIKNLALDRAYGDCTVTISFLADKYNISEANVRRVIEHAIITPGYISDKEVSLIERRASQNQFPHSQKTVTAPTNSYYGDLLYKRRKNFEKMEQEDESEDHEIDYEKAFDRFKEISYLLDNFDHIYPCDQESEKLKEALEKELYQLEKLLDYYYK